MTVVINKAQRGPGLIDTGTITIGALAQPGVEYVLAGLMNAADEADTTLSITAITMFLDGQIVWGPSDWHGGTTTDRNGTPVPPRTSWGTNDPNVLPTTVRLEATLSKRVAFGLDLSTIPLSQ